MKQSLLSFLPCVLVYSGPSGGENRGAHRALDVPAQSVSGDAGKRLACSFLFLFFFDLARPLPHNFMQRV